MGRLTFKLRVTINFGYRTYLDIGWSFWGGKYRWECTLSSILTVQSDTSAEPMSWSDRVLAKFWRQRDFSGAIASFFRALSEKLKVAYICGSIKSARTRCFSDFKWILRLSLFSENSLKLLHQPYFDTLGVSGYEIWCQGLSRSLI